MKIEDLKPAPYNPRTISGTAQAGLAKSIERFGDLSGIVWNEKTGHVVSGHQRIDRLKSLGATFREEPPAFVLGDRVFPVRVVSWTETKEKAANVTANNPHIAGEFDATLDALLEEIRADVPEFDELGLEMLLADVEPVSESAVTDAEPQISRADELREKWGVSAGQIWRLGEHRLLCGDSKREDDVAALAGGEKFDMLLTDPPYGVSYVGKTKDALRIDNDELDESGLSEFISIVFDSAQKHCREGAYWYATVPARPLHLVFAFDWKRRGILRQIMVWAKNSMVLGHSEYHYQHEPILFGWVPGERHKNQDRTRTTLWQFDRPSASREHPTVKPVPLFAKAVSDGSILGDTVFDPFCGSGTTIIACEQLGRKCRAIEISPAYVAVALQRWADATGKTPVIDEA